MNDTKQIKEMIKDGSFYRDAIEWYSIKYVYPFTMRSSIAILTLILAIGLVISIETARMSFVSMKVPFPIYAKDEVKFLPIIKPLLHQNNSIEEAVARYFVTKYIMLREGYNYFDFSDDNKSITFNKIKALSSHFIYNQYQDFFDTNRNPDSPIIKYKNQVQRLIIINEIDIKAFDSLPEKATVKFTSNEVIKNNNTISTEYISEISFMMSDVTKVFEKTMPLYFKVVKYKTYKLSK